MIQEFTVEIDDKSEAYQELMDIVAEINQEDPAVAMTDEEYVQNIVINWLENRVREAYVQNTRRMPISELRQKVGHFADIKTMNKRKQP